MAQTIKLAIFDLDGTLIDSLADLASATNHMLAFFDRPRLGVDEVRMLVGQGARRLVERALLGVSPEEVERGLELFLDYNLSHIVERTALYPGVAETLARLGARGVRLAVISNKNVALCRTVLSILGADHFFEEIMGADSLPQRKPSPEPVLKLLGDFGVTAGEAVIVGDSINDIAAGKGAGVATVGCTWGYGEPVELEEADFRIDAFPEILALPIFDCQQ